MFGDARGEPRAVAEPQMSPGSTARRGLTAFAIVVAVLAAFPALPGGPLSGLPAAPGRGHDGAVPGTATMPGRPAGDPRLARLVSIPLPSASRDRDRAAIGYGTESWLAYDPVDELFFVADGGTTPGTVDVIPGAFATYSPTVLASVPVGNTPFGVVYDAGTGDVFVSNNGSNNVSVLVAHTYRVRASVDVGSAPMGIAYDPDDHEVYVANQASGTVSAINDTTLAVVATVPVGSRPLGVAVDAATNKVYVANHGSSNISVISGATDRVVANLDVPAGPYGVAVDNRSDAVYVTDEGAGAISAINGTTGKVFANYTVSNPSFGVDLQGIAYDSGDGQLYAGGGPISLVILSPNGTVRVANYDPSGVAYDSTTGDICVTNTANLTFECGTFSSGLPAGPYPLEFSSHGLASNGSWAVDVDGAYAWGTTTSGWNLTFKVANGTYPFTVYAGTSAEHQLPTPSGGLVTVAGAHVIVNVDLGTNASYGVRFSEQGLPNGSAWSVPVADAVDPLADLGQASEASSTGANATITLVNGTYQFLVPPTGGFYASPSYGIVQVDGNSLVINVTFAAPVPVLYPVSFLETGLAAGNPWEVDLGGVVQTSFNTTDGFDVTNGTYAYTISATGYAANLSSGSLDVNGSGVDVSVAFAGTSVYFLVFRESGLPTGTGWGVLLGSQAQSSLTPNVTFAEPNGTYAYVILAVTGFVTTSSGHAVVNGSTTVVAVAFHPQLYPIVFVEFGLPTGSNWSVTVVNTSLGINETQSTTGNSLTFFLPNGTYTAYYTLPTGYTGNVTSTTITVAGRAETGGTVTATGPGTGRTGTTKPNAAQVPLWLFGAVLGGLVVAFLLGIVLSRFRRPPPPPETAGP